MMELKLLQWNPDADFQPARGYGNRPAWAPRRAVFVDFLARAGRVSGRFCRWDPPGMRTAPTRAVRPLAGNPYFIDLDLLAKDGLLQRKDYAFLQWGTDEDRVEYGTLYNRRFPVLRKAYENFLKRRPVPGFETPYPDDWYRFQFLSADWLPDYCLYMAIKEENGMIDWQQWPRRCGCGNRRRWPSSGRACPGTGILGLPAV